MRSVAVFNCTCIQKVGIFVYNYHSINQLCISKLINVFKPAIALFLL